jgi:hypothetical protein
MLYSAPPGVVRIRPSVSARERILRKVIEGERELVSVYRPRHTTR